MMVDVLLRSLGVVVAPLVAFLIFILQEGRRRARLAKRAKTAAELVNLTPSESPMYSDLVAHYEQAVAAYLDSHGSRVRRRRDWFYLRSAFLPGVFTLLLASLGWALIAGRPAWMTWIPDTPHKPASGWTLIVLGVIPLLALTVWNVRDFLRSGKPAATSTRR